MVFQQVLARAQPRITTEHLLPPIPATMRNLHLLKRRVKRGASSPSWLIKSVAGPNSNTIPSKARLSTLSPRRHILLKDTLPKDTLHRDTPKAIHHRANTMEINPQGEGTITVRPR